MSEEVNFESLNIPIPEAVKTYSLEKQREIFEYLNEKSLIYIIRWWFTFIIMSLFVVK